MKTLKEQLYNYYREQLEKIDRKSQYAPTVQLKSVDAKTNHLSLNDESATELVRWLKQHYHISFDESLHVLKVKILQWTNTKPRRIKIISERFKQSVIIPYTDDGPQTVHSWEIAKNWLTSKGFVINGHAEGDGHEYITSETFKPLKEK